MPVISCSGGLVLWGTAKAHALVMLFSTMLSIQLLIFFKL